MHFKERLFLGDVLANTRTDRELGMISIRFISRNQLTEIHLSMEGISGGRFRKI